MLEEWDSLDHKTRKPTGRVLEKEVTYFKKLTLDEFKQLEGLKEHGFYIIQFN